MSSRLLLCRCLCFERARLSAVIELQDVFTVRLKDPTSRKGREKWGHPSLCCSHSSTLVMETVAEFDVQFAGIVPVETAEGVAVVEFDAAIGYIDGVYGRRESFAEVLAQGHVKRGVLGQVVSRVRFAGKGVGETGTVVNVGG